MNNVILRSTVYPGEIYIRNLTIELFDFELLRFWLWPLTFRDRCIVPLEKPVRDFLYKINIDISPPYHTVNRFEDIWLQSFEGLTLTFNI